MISDYFFVTLRAERPELIRDTVRSTQFPKGPFGALMGAVRGCWKLRRLGPGDRSKQLAGRVSQPTSRCEKSHVELEKSEAS